VGGYKVEGRNGNMVITFSGERGRKKVEKEKKNCEAFKDFQMAHYQKRKTCFLVGDR
jgi:hypothetical protein